jgi:hypothetical protein
VGLLRRFTGTQPTRVEPPSSPAAEPAVFASVGAKCPHCGVVLDPIPPRRRLCPSCRKPIIPRSRADGTRVVICEEDIPAFEAEKEAWYAARARQGWIDKARQFTDEAGFVAIERELAAKQAGYTPRDVFRAAANRAVIELIRRNDWGTLAAVYSELALDEYREANVDQAPEQVVTLLRESGKAELRSYLAAGVSRVDIIACACSVCARGPKRRLPIRIELAEPHIPHGNCREGYCSCDYVPCID